MVEIEFNYRGEPFIIQGQNDEKMKDIITRYKSKSEIKSNLYFLYSGLCIDSEKTLVQIINHEDKNRKKMNVIVNDAETEPEGETSSIYYSKNIICPQCKESARINFKDYKIKLECNNGHTANNIFFNKFKETQEIDLSLIICDECNKTDKSKTYDNTFFICLTCNKFLCPNCKSIHDKKIHKIINYDDKDYICEKHNEKYLFFCEDCRKNICVYCEGEHNREHNLISYGKILPNVKEVEENIKLLRETIDKLKNCISHIIEKLNKTIENLEYYYNINNEIFKSYNKMNHQNLFNIKSINNSEIKKDLDFIIKNTDINEQFKLINNIYEKMMKKDDEELYIIYDLKNNISSGFLGKSFNKNSIVKLFGKKFVENNKAQCKIIIDNKKYELSEEFPLNNLKKVTENIEIKLVGIQNITDISYMFDNCSSLKSIKNIDSWDTSTIKLMVGVFSKCTSLKSLPNISNLNTKNVTDMKRLFFGCSSLEYISDISRWNTENVNNMSFMFYECSSLKSLPDISKSNTSNVTNFYRTFYNCKVLISLPDISQWNTSNVTNMSYMFSGCVSLKSVPDISKWSVNNVKNIGWMFSGCKSLISLPNISNWNLDRISGVNTIFDGCNK